MVTVTVVVDVVVGVVHTDTGAAVVVDVEVLQTYFLEPEQTTSSHLPELLMTTQSCLLLTLLG